MKMRRSPQLALVLAEFLAQKKEWRYGYDISRSTGLKSGTLYPILMRLAENRLLKTEWEDPVEGRPPRHLYRLTDEGLRYARELAAVAPAASVKRLVPAEVTG